MLWYFFYQSKTYNRNIKKKMKRQLTLRLRARPTSSLALAQPTPFCLFFPAAPSSTVAETTHAAAPPRRREAPGPPRDPFSCHGGPQCHLVLTLSPLDALS